MPVRKDEFTVIMDDGQEVYMPELPAVEGGPASNPESGADFGETRDGGQSVPAYPETPELVQNKLAGYEQETADAQLTDQAFPTPDQPVELPADMQQRVDAQRPMKPAEVRAIQQAQKAESQVSDITDYSARGGVLKTNEDYARGVGGVGKATEDAAVAKAEAEDITRQAKATGNQVLSDSLNETATWYEKAANDISQKQEKRWSDWRKRNDDAAKALVDPRRAYNNMGTGTKLMWMVGFIGAGMAGGNTLNTVMTALDNEIENDIAAQKAGIANLRQGLDQEAGALKSLDGDEKDALLKHASAREIRFKALEKQIDSRIAQVGAESAKRSGLLDAKAKVAEKVMEGQTKIKDQLDKERMEGIKQANDIALARLNHNLRMSEKAEDLENKRKEKGMSQGTLPLDTKLGLMATDKNGNKLEGSIPLRFNTDTEAGTAKVAEAANMLASSQARGMYLKQIHKLLKDTSDTDILRGGGAELKSLLNKVAMEKAKLQNNGRAPTDKDALAAMFQEVGLEQDGSLGKMWSAAVQPGNQRKGALNVVESNLRNISQETELALQPYLTDGAAQNLRFTFDQRTDYIQPPDSTGDTANQSLTRLGEGADVTDLTATKPVREPLKTSKEASGKSFGDYAKEKEAGTLPKLPPKEEARVREAIDAFQTASSEDIRKSIVAKTRAPGITEEAKYRIKAEGYKAELEAMDKEKTLDQIAEFNALGGNALGIKASGNKEAIENAAKAIEAYKKSDMFKEMQREYGVAPKREK